MNWIMGAGPAVHITRHVLPSVKRSGIFADHSSVVIESGGLMVL